MSCECHVQQANDEAPIPWDKISHSIRSTQPPCVADLPAHIAFCKKYGGGTKQVLLKSTLEYLTIAMPHGRKVSGNFIKALADVPISAAVQLPRLLHAAIKIQATCKHVEDDTGRQVTLADVKGLTGKFAAVASRAQNILQRTAETIVNAKRDAVVELSDFEKMIFLSVVGKVDESPEIIAANFVTTFFGPQSSADAPDASSSGGESKPPCIVEFDSHGHALNVGQQTVNEAGFQQGAFVVAKSDPSHRFAIQYISSDGSVGLHPESQLGKVDESQIDNIPMQRFLEGYYRVGPIRIDDRTPLVESPSFKTEWFKSILTIAMHQLWKDDTSDVTVIAKPERKVIAMSDFEPSTMTMVPIVAMAGIRDIKPNETSHFVAKVTDYLGTSHRFAMVGGNDKDFVSPAFCVRTVGKEGPANLQKLVTTIQVPVRVTSNTNRLCTVEYPTLTNSDAVRKGDELTVVQTVVKAKAAAKTRALDMGGGAKKQRTE